MSRMLSVSHYSSNARVYRRSGTEGRAKDTIKLQALVYDILPLEEGAVKRCSEWDALSPEGVHGQSVQF